MRHIHITLMMFFVVAIAARPVISYGKSEPLNTQSINSTPALIKADTITYDSEKEIATAIGNVEITQGSRIMIADTLSYDKKNNIVHAIGHVSLLEPNGTVIFADNVELSDGLKKGIVDNFSARFPDNSVMAAKSGERIDENIIVMNNVVYSPCLLCKEKPDQAPLWQVAAKKATIDNKAQRVVYNNAFFDIYGVSTIYTPYFSHPTPDADRKSGLLTPKYYHDRIFGTMVKVPYYYDIAPNMDATITPILTSNEGGILSGEYRHLLLEGNYNLKGSITNPDKVDSTGNKTDGNDIRGHIEGAGEFKANDTWNWGFSGKRASDDTYLKKYNFGDEDVLISNLYTNKIENRDHILVNTLSFQGLKATDDPGRTPLILPYAESHTERNVGTLGAKATLDTNILALTRAEGISTKRVSVKGGVQQPYITKSGQVFKAGLSLRGDGYIVDNVIDPSNPNNTHDGFQGRTIPEADLTWSLPLIKHTPKRQYLLEPITKIIVSPNGGNPDKIPNEDSQDIEFSDANLFDNNHFAGYDQVEGGARMNYGLRGGASDSQKGDINFLFGQSYRAKSDNNFSQQSGLSDNFSDYVGKIGYNKNNIFDVAYKFRFDKDDLAVRNNSIAGAVTYAPVHFTLDYVAINENSAATPSSTSSDNREIIIAGTKIDLTEKWQFSADGNRNLASKEWVSTKSGFVYKGACVDFSLDWLKEFTRDRDIQPSSTISFQVSLKNMGQRRTN